MVSAKIRSELLKFRADREWEQFHTPMNLAVALSVEAGELLQCFQWRESSEARLSDERRTAVEHEIADLAILLTYLCHDLNVDVDAAVRAKVAINEQRYPVEKARGRATKYDKLG